MKKSWGLGLVVALILAVAGYFGLRTSSSPELDESNAKQSYGPTLEYETEIEVRQRVEGQGEALVLALKGMLAQSRNPELGALSRWKSLSQFILMNKEQDDSNRDLLLNKDISSDYVSQDNAFIHHFPNDFPRDFIPFHASFLHRTLLPFSLEELTKVTTLRAKDRDEVGEHDVIYTLANNVIEKRWTRYYQDFIKVDGKAKHFIFTFRPDGRMETLDGALVLHYRQSTPTRFEIRIRMKLAHESNLALKSIDKKTAITYSEAEIAKGVEGQTPSLLKFDESLKALDQLTDQTESSEAYRIFSSLKYAVDQDPSLAAKIIDRINATKDRTADARRRLSVLFGSLSQSSDSGISTSLAELAKTCPDNFCKIQAIAAVNTHPNPSSASLETMLELGKSQDTEIAANALLAAGAAGSHMVNAPEELASTLINAASDGAKPELKSAAIAAMGNHGISEYLPSLQKNLQDSSSSIRSAAAYSMRFISDPSVDQTLINTLSQDKDTLVIRDTLKALDYRSLSRDDYGKIAKAAANLSDGENQRLTARVILQAYREDPSLVTEHIQTLKDSLKDEDAKTYLNEELEAIERDRAEAQKPQP